MVLSPLKLTTNSINAAVQLFMTKLTSSKTHRHCKTEIYNPQTKIYLQNSHRLWVYAIQFDSFTLAIAHKFLLIPPKIVYLLCSLNNFIDLPTGIHTPEHLMHVIYTFNRERLCAV